MRGLLSRIAIFKRLRKRAGAKRTPDAVPPVPVPVPVPVDNGSIPGPGSAHLDAPQQQLDGAVEGPVERAVVAAVSNAAETANSTNSSANRFATRVTTLEALPAELRCHILTHVAHDLGSLRALVTASPFYYQQYLLDRKALLRAGLKATLGNSLVDAYAVQASASLYGTRPKLQLENPYELQLETITLFIDNHVTLRSAAPDVILEECCTEEDLIGMTAFYDSVARPLTGEFATRFLSRLDNTSVDAANNLTGTEFTRLLRALYRYQLYCNLFGQGSDGYYRKVPRVQSGHHLDIFFCIFKPWEIEEIYCIYILLRNTYSDVLDTIAWDLNRDHPKFKDWPNPLAPGSWDLESSFIRDSLIEGTAMRGLLPFYDVVRADDHEELVTDMQYYLVCGADIIEHALDSTNQYFRRERHPLEGDYMEARRARLPFSGDAEDGPPLAWVIYWRGRYSNSYGGIIEASLQSWGHVFWDRERLIRSKGTEAVLRERPEGLPRW